MTFCAGEPDCCEHEFTGLLTRDGRERSICLECGIDWPVEEKPHTPGDVAHPYGGIL